MTSSEVSQESPRAGRETAHLFGVLDEFRTTFRWKADALDEGGLCTIYAALAAAAVSYCLPGE